MVPLNIIFMGTPDFAVTPLAALHAAGYNIVAVYSQPPRPAGRGQKDTPSPVSVWASEHNIPVYTPVSLRNVEAHTAFAAHNADIAVVAAYGLILPVEILQGTPMGCINIHPSLLPRWRGAAPLQRTLMAGDTKTGVCIMQMEAGLDTGPVLMMEEFDIPETMDAGSLHDTLSALGAKLLLDVLPALAAGIITPQTQPESGVTYAQKITKQDAIIDWRKNAKEVACQIRSLSPSPGAQFIYNGEHVKIYSAHYEENIPHGGIHKAGTVFDENLSIACGKGAIRPVIVQRAGKKRMSTEEMLKGFPIPQGTVLHSPETGH